MVSDQGSGSQDDDARDAVILFVDICGSVPLYESTGDLGALKLISNALDEMELVVKGNGGSVVRSKGDDLLCTFDTPTDALDAATDILSSITQADTAVRMGVHHGQVIEARGDIFGDAVNVAARMLQLAKPGEMLCTEAVVSRLPPARREWVRPLGTRAIKGKDDPIAIYSMVLDLGESTLLVNPDTVMERALEIQAETQVVLQQAGRSWTVRTGDGELRIGRSPRCDIQIQDGSVSREHATLQVAPGRVSFIDHSTAGSWVCVSGEPIMGLKRESLPLSGEGVICFGSAPTGNRKPPRLGFSVLGVDTESVRNRYSTVELGGRIQARKLERTALTPFQVQVALEDHSDSVEAALWNLTEQGANLRSRRCLGSEAQEITVHFGPGGPSVRATIRFCNETGPEAWSHGVLFSSLEPEVRSVVQGLLYQNNPSR